jgi:RHS repeat-associated protein
MVVKGRANPPGEPLFPSCDANGNISEYVDGGGSVVAQYEYDAFGNEISRSGAEAQSIPFRFSTKYFDDETSLYYYGYRYYSPTLGRWINRDPLVENAFYLAFAQRNLGLFVKAFVEVSEQSINAYCLLTNEPVGKYDYLGLQDGGTCTYFCIAHPFTSYFCVLSVNNCKPCYDCVTWFFGQPILPPGQRAPWWFWYSMACSLVLV